MGGGAQGAAGVITQKNPREGGPTHVSLSVMMATGETLRCPEVVMGGRGFWGDDP